MEHTELFKSVLRLESEALIEAERRISTEQVQKMVEIFQEIIDINSSLIFCGVGKSGLIAKKLASTFSSLGLPSFFLHPVEALHGDLGLLRPNDVIVFLSKSGTTEEILKLLPFIPITKQRRIGLLGDLTSPIAQQCSLNFDCSIRKEACINNQAPTTSSTLTLAVGDAMAVLYERIVNLTKENFAINHPGGILGKSLRIKVDHLMISRNECPCVNKDACLKDVILEMTRFPLGGCAVLENEKHLLGIIVEGDIRRTFTKEHEGLQTNVCEIMNKNPITVSPDEMASKALELMEKRKEGPIGLLPVTKDNCFLGLIRLHDILKEGFSLEA